MQGFLDSSIKLWVNRTSDLVNSGTASSYRLPWHARIQEKINTLLVTKNLVNNSMIQMVPALIKFFLISDLSPNHKKDHWVGLKTHKTQNSNTIQNGTLNSYRSTTPVQLIFWQYCQMALFPQRHLPATITVSLLFFSYFLYYNFSNWYIKSSSHNFR